MIYGKYSVCWGRRMKNIIFEIRPAEYGIHHTLISGDHENEDILS